MKYTITLASGFNPTARGCSEGYFSAHQDATYTGLEPAWPAMGCEVSITHPCVFLYMMTTEIYRAVHE
jgi:hypothetical protein